MDWRSIFSGYLKNRHPCWFLLATFEAIIEMAADLLNCRTGY
jgi:hypothetical protein